MIKKRFIALILVLFLTFPIYPLTSNAASTGSVSGQVVSDSTNAPLENILVDLFPVDEYGNSDLTRNPYRGNPTDSNGNYYVPGLEPGYYKVYFNPNGQNYLPQYFNNQPDWDSASLVQVVADYERSGINARLADGGFISGQITLESSSTPLSGATIKAYPVTDSGGIDSARLTLSTISDSNGNYTIQGLSGKYKVKANKSGYFDEYFDQKTDWDTATIVTVTPPNETSNINFSLAPLNTDIYEPDNVSSEAKSISTDGSPQSRTIFPAGDIDWINFFGTSGSYYIVKAFNLSDEMSAVLEFYGPDDATTYIDTAFNSYGEVEYVFRADQTGTYFIKVTHENTSTGIGSYDLSVTLTTDPHIDFVSPDYGRPGDPVTIYGYNFGSSQGTSTVTFNGVEATEFWDDGQSGSPWQDDKINVIVPAGARDGNVIVTVNGVQSNGFYFETGPKITSIDPTSGNPGTQVIIYGYNFGSSQGTSTVTFAGTVANVVSWSNTQITAEVPTDAISGYVIVTVEGVDSNGVYFTVPGTTDVTPPEPPTGLTAEDHPNDTGGAIDLSWSPSTSPDVAYYGIFRSTVPDAATNGALIDTTTGTSYTDTNVIDGTTYYYVVRAYDFAPPPGGPNESNPSNEASAYSYENVPPDAPTNLTATAGDSIVDLTWNASLATDTAGYYIYRSLTSGSGYTRVNATPVSETSYRDSNLPKGTTYYYVVKAVDNWGNESGPSNEVSATPFDTIPPNPPTGLSAWPTDYAVVLSWDSNVESDTAGYNIYRSLTSGSNYTFVSYTTNTDYTDSGLTNGTTYYYIITAIDTSGNESSSSAEVWATPYDNVAPDPPASVEATDTPNDQGGSITLNWSASLATDTAGYHIFRSLTSGSGYVQIATTTSTNFTDTNLANGTTYYYVITAFDEVPNESTYSVEVSATPLDNLAPTTPTITSVMAGNSYIDLAWTSSPETDTAGYKIWWGIQSGLYTNVIDVGNTTSYQLQSLNNGTTYYLAVSAYDSSGNESSKSAEVAATPSAPSGGDTGGGEPSNGGEQKDTVPPATPTGLTAIAGDALVTLTWDPNTEEDLAGYNVYRNTTEDTATATKLNLSALITETSFEDTSVVNGQTYYYFVSAVDKHGNESNLSKPVSALPLPTISFSDVPESYWAYPYIIRLAQEGIINGYPDGTFKPQKSITRAEFAKIVLLAVGYTPNTIYKGYFPDVSYSHWAWPYIEKAKELGIIKGYPDGLFRPNEEISRAEITKMVVSAAGYSISTFGFPFPDVPWSHWAYNYVMTARNQKIVSGYPDGTFRPEGLATRAEAAKVIYEMKY